MDRSHGATRVAVVCLLLGLAIAGSGVAVADSTRDAGALDDVEQFLQQVDDFLETVVDIVQTVRELGGEGEAD